MLIIEYFNNEQKYVEKTDPFRYKDLKGKLEQTQEYANVHPEISGGHFLNPSAANCSLFSRLIGKFNIAAIER